MLDLSRMGGGPCALEALVDARRHGAHLRLVVLVLLDAGARRRGDLDEGEPARSTPGSVRATARWRESAPGCPWCSRGGRRRRRACVGGQVDVAAGRRRGSRHRLSAASPAPAASRSRSDSGAPRSACRRSETVNVSRSTRASSKRSTVSRKLLQWNWVWKPRMLLPEHPSSSSSRHGQMANASGLGQGMCQKVMIVASGSSSRIIRGSSAKW